MKILIASSIDQNAIDKLREHHDVVCAFNAPKDTLQSRIADREVLVFRSGVQIDAEVMVCAPDLRLLVRAGCGLDNLDLNYVRQHNLKLIRIPGPGAQAVAEMAFALMLALGRRVLEADRLLRQGRWAKNEMKGYLLKDKTLGIVGCGNIGTRVGQLGAALGMHPIGCVEHPSPKIAAKLHEQGIALKDFHQVLRQADFLSINVPLQQSTRYLINEETLALMKPGAYLVNLARGGVVDEAALLKTLTEGKLRGAALDVHEKEGEGKISPLAGLPNVILTPHIGAMAVDSQHEIGRLLIGIIESYVADHAKFAAAEDLVM